MDEFSFFREIREGARLTGSFPLSYELDRLATLSTYRSMQDMKFVEHRLVVVPRYWFELVSLIVSIEPYMPRAGMSSQCAPVLEREYLRWLYSRMHEASSDYVKCF